MLIRQLNIRSFGGLNEQSLTLSEGINVIYGPNESGKTTLHAFIRSMLFGMERTRGKGARHDLYTHYTPWESSGLYGGSMSFDLDDTPYLLERTFLSREKINILTNEETGRSLENFQDIGTLIEGLTPSAYDNTISLGQLKTETGPQLALQIQSHLINLTTSGNRQINVKEALDKLKKEKKALEKTLQPQLINTKHQLERQMEDLDQKILAHAAKAPGRAPCTEKKDLELKRQIESLKTQMEVLKRQAEQKEQSLLKLKAALLSSQQQTEAVIEHDANNHKRIETDFLDTASHLDKAKVDLSKNVYNSEKSKTGLSKNASDSRKAALRFLLYTSLFLTISGICLGILHFTLFQDTTFLFPLSLILLITGLITAACFAYLSKKKLLPSSSDPSAITPDAGDQAAFVTQSHSDSAILTLSKDLASLNKERSQLMAHTIKLQEIMSSWQSESLESSKNQWASEHNLQERNQLAGQLEDIQAGLLRNETIETEIAALDLAISVIQEASLTIHDSHGPDINQTFASYAKSITQGAYEALYIDENLNISLHTGSRIVPLNSLSQGTIEQLYLALRLTAVNLLFPHSPMPLLFDDSFVFYDDQRLEQTLTWLAETYPGQLIIFTCQQREAQLLSKQGIPFHMVQLL